MVEALGIDLLAGAQSERPEQRERKTTPGAKAPAEMPAGPNL